MADTKTLADLGSAMGMVPAAAGSVVAAPVAPVQPKIDAKGRSYATGRRKNAIARVWIKRGKGKSLLTANRSKLISRVPFCACFWPSQCTL